MQQGSDENDKSLLARAIKLLSNFQEEVLLLKPWQPPVHSVRNLVFAGLKDTADKSKKLPLKMAGYEYDRVAGLVDGRVNVAGCDASFEAAGIGDMNTDVFSGGQTRDVTEIGLHPYMLAYANEGFRDYSLIPVFPLRVFRHKSIFININSGIKQPEDLRGRKVATPGFSSTSLTWLRGIMQHEYGVRPDEIEWVVSTKDSSAGVSGKVSKQETMIPEGLKVSQGPAGKDESDLLVDGDVDALFHAAEPRAYMQGHPMWPGCFLITARPSVSTIKKPVSSPSCMQWQYVIH